MNNFIIFLLALIFGMIIGIFVIKDCYHGPNAKETSNIIFEENGECYKFIPEKIDC